MYECEYWACVDKAAYDSAVCVSHEPLFDQGKFDDCHVCDQLKEVEFALCGDCESMPASKSLLEFSTGGYGRDNLDWADDGW